MHGRSEGGSVSTRNLCYSPAGKRGGQNAFYAGEMTLIVVTGVSSISEAAREGSIFIEVVED